MLLLSETSEIEDFKRDVVDLGRECFVGLELMKKTLNEDLTVKNGDDAHFYGAREFY